VAKKTNIREVWKETTTRISRRTTEKPKLSKEKGTGSSGVARQKKENEPYALN